MTELKANQLYAQLDLKLREIGWSSGASEAHGLLAGLACRGFPATHIANKMHMFELNSDQDSSPLIALYEVILQNLQSDSPVFDLMLPDENETAFVRAEEIANWCSGFAQGFCHDGEAVVSKSTGSVKELFHDIMEIARMQAGPADDEQSRQREERDLNEIEQFLRVGVQLIYEEMAVNPCPQTVMPQ